MSSWVLTDEGAHYLALSDEIRNTETTLKSKLQTNDLERVEVCELTRGYYHQREYGTAQSLPRSFDGFTWISDTKRGTILSVSMHHDTTQNKLCFLLNTMPSPTADKLRAITKKCVPVVHTRIRFPRRSNEPGTDRRNKPIASFMFAADMGGLDSSMFWYDLWSIFNSATGRHANHADARRLYGENAVARLRKFTDWCRSACVAPVRIVASRESYCAMAEVSNEWIASSHMPTIEL
ncbi:hypothetical protein CERZMDRAFT_84607 [Cercospora zeae-maydis SCOH1-5]|uniref:Uncharacterized protein n=1 Tax=Cercospora zeae-maydis SCOH1-5 TaxID=717836 RepID=A0A6A6FFL1_9PEZI|nr:hypothetical protein CERZMDRAFT_84607 [Cercospora zeae-maydis SCOH1-5]